MAIPTQPRMNMFMNTCQPASQPRSNSDPRPLNRSVCHSACVYASDRRKIRADTKDAIAVHAAKNVYQRPRSPCAYTTPVIHIGVSVAVCVLKTEEAGSHHGSPRPARKKSDSERRARR
jgi:hypothetical protein